MRIAHDCAVLATSSQLWHTAVLCRTAVAEKGLCRLASKARLQCNSDIPPQILAAPPLCGLHGRRLKGSNTNMSHNAAVAGLWGVYWHDGPACPGVRLLLGMAVKVAVKATKGA